ncbi:hypothetical protein Tco_1031008 [Tanacetum coccineum]|uniref:Uncharacterized protein n=1 Tax=Tanacetum coccineum TaxID=301880 RepID=A0ABQ5GA32_9ASTR
MITTVQSAVEGVIQPPQETSVEILQAKEDLMKSIQTFLKKFNRISFRETPKVLSLAWEKFFEIQHAQPEDIQELLHKLLKDLQIIREELAEYINSPSWNRPSFYDDDDEYTIQYKEYLENSSNTITPDLPTEEPDNSLSIGDEHFSTIPETESDEVIMSSVEDLVPILNTSIVYSPKIYSLLEEFADELNTIPPGIHEADFDPEEDIRLIEKWLYDDCTSSDDDSFENIDYVEASPLDSELVSIEEVKDDILYEKLLNIYLLIATIESLNDNPTPDCVLNDHTKKTSSGSTTTHADNSLPEYDSFLFETEPDQGELISVVMGEPLSFPSGTRNNIFDPGIFFEVQSKRFLSWDTFSISFIRDPLSPVFDTLLLFSYENEEKVFNPGSLSSNEEKSPHLLSYRGFNPSKIISDFSEIPMMIYGEDIPILDVPITPDYEASRARGFVHRSLELHILSFIMGIEYPNLID